MTAGSVKEAMRRADKGHRFTHDERALVKEARRHSLGSAVKEALRRAYVGGYTDAGKGERPRHPVRTEAQRATVETGIAEGTTEKTKRIRAAAELLGAEIMGAPRGVRRAP